ncbi:RNA-binding protein [Candidatus Saccharibacteria bacterium RAAC3_TM7_1]|nr:RNA-binding protein [Candidatus Saccharibacteria bacterium RAAC3_TM7_1]
MTTIDQQFVEYIVKSLVEHPGDVTIDRIIDEKGVLLTLTVNPEDLGRVIGKRGMTAQSLRTLLRALGTKNDARYNLKIVNNDDQRESYTMSSDEPSSQPVDDRPVTATDDDDDEVVENSQNNDESDYAKKSRKELAELDDLDI